MSEPYIPQSRLLAQLMAEQRQRPVQSIGQGLADVAGDVGTAYFEKKQSQKQAQALASLLQAMGPNAAQDASGNAGTMNGQMFTPNQSQAGQSAGPMSPGMQYGQVSLPQDISGAQPLTQAQRLAQITPMLKDPNALQALPQAMQLASAFAPKPPEFHALGKEGAVQTDPQTGRVINTIAGAPKAQEPGSPLAKAALDLRNGLITKDEYNAIKAHETQLTRPPEEGLVQVYDPSSPTGVKYVSKAQAAGMPGPGAERKQRMQTFWSADGGAQTLDANDPEDQKIIKSQGLVSSAPTDNERGAKGFLDRMGAAEQVMGGLTSKGFNPANKSDKIAGAVPLVGNMMVSDQAQSYKQAQEDWVRAKLRKESGAVIGKDEMADEIKTYFPQVGDNETTQAQKMRSRREAERQLATGAGILGRKRLGELDTPQTTTPGAPPVGTVEDGHRFKGGNPADPNSWELV